MPKITIYILLAIAVIVVLVYNPFRRNKPEPENENNMNKPQKITGVIKNMGLGCFTTGPCTVVLEPNIVIMVAYNPGDVAPALQENGVWGKVGFELDKKYIGSKVEAWAKSTGSLKDGEFVYYTLEGNEDYYIKLIK